MASGIISSGNLTATVNGTATISGTVKPKVELTGEVGIPKSLPITYTAGEGIAIDDKVISIDFTIIDCGRGTTVQEVGMGGTIGARIQLKRESTQYWNEALGFIPLEGELIIYNDYKQIDKEIDGEVKRVNIPGLKIGDGMAYVQDLPFVNEDLRDKIMEHIDNPDIHVTLADKFFWNNKLNVNDADELVDGALILNRN